MVFFFLFLFVIIPAVNNTYYYGRGGYSCYKVPPRVIPRSPVKWGIWMPKIGSMAIVMESSVTVGRPYISPGTSSHIGIAIVYGDIFTPININIVSITYPIVITLIASVNVSGVFTPICGSVGRTVLRI